MTIKHHNSQAWVITVSIKLQLQTLKLQVNHMICATNEHYRDRYNREKLFTFSRQLLIDLPVFSPLGVCSLRRQELIAVNISFNSSLLLLFLIWFMYSKNYLKLSKISYLLFLFFQIISVLFTFVVIIRQFRLRDGIGY